MTTTRALVACVVLAALVAALATSTRGAGPFSFPHRPHLSAAAITAGGTGTGSDTDCRVCHDYAKGEREAHLAGCDKCHVDAAHLEKKLAGAYSRPAFQHKEHLFDAGGKARADVSCFTCHAMRVDYDFIEFTVPPAGLGPKSRAGETKTCADCHAAHETSGGLVKQDEKTGDGKACAVCHLKETSILPIRYRGDTRPSGKRSFAHADHGAAASDCATCHDGVKTSKTIWDYDATVVTTVKCASCHVDSAGRTVVALSPQTTSVTKIDFSNFPHEKHLGTFSRMSCKTCHFPETDDTGRAVFPGRVASPEPVGRAQLVRFAACDACHGKDGWAPQKTSWHVEGHGVGAWACFKCHDGYRGADGKLAIASARKKQRGSLLFALPEHSHPAITRAGPSLSDATQAVAGDTRRCIDCHLADVPSLPSRASASAFVHTPHVAAMASTSECLACHADAGLARRSEDVLNYGEDRCSQCHLGPLRGGGLAERPGSRTVPQFDHAGHVRAASLVEGVKGVACTECHTKGGKFGYETPPDVLNCTKCHAHEGDAAKVARTGPKSSAGDASKCLFCHDKVRNFESNGHAPPRETVTRSHLQLLDGVQQHDKTGDCAACHVREGAAATPYAERISSAKIQLSIHDDPKFADKPFNDPKGDCAVCHRTPPRGYLRSLGRR